MATTIEIQNEIIETKTVEDFFKIHEIPYVYMFVDIWIDENGEKQKVLEHIPNGWKEWAYDQTQASNSIADPKCNAIMVNLTKSEFCGIDNDVAAKKEEVLELYGDTHYTESTRHGLPHLYRKKHFSDQDKTANIIDKKDGNGQKLRGYDIIYDCYLEWKHAPLINWDGKIPVYKNTIKNDKPAKKEKVKNEKQYDESKVSNYDTAILDNIDVKYWTDYESWFKLIGAIIKDRNCNYLLADKYSKKSPSYGGIQSIIDYTSNAIDSNISWGTVEYYSKLSNADSHQQIKDKY